MATSQTKIALVHENDAPQQMAVTARHISKSYGDVEALRDLSLEFPKGQLYFVF